MFTLDDKFFGCFFDVPAASGGGIWSLAGQDGVLGFFPHTHAFLLCSPLPSHQIEDRIYAMWGGAHFVAISLLPQEKPSDFGQGLRAICCDSDGKWYGRKVPLGARSALVQ